MLGFVPNLDAQSEKLYDQHIWLEGFVAYPFSKKVEFFADASYRFVFTKKENWCRVMARPSLKWNLLNWMDLRGGLGVFYSNFKEDDDILEVRPWQGLNVSWPKLKYVKFAHLVRVEQQILYNTSTWDRRFVNRFRYQLSSRIKLSATKKFKYFFIPLSAEFFFRTDPELNKFLRNDGRYTVGLGYVLNRKITFNVRYFIQRSRSDEFDFTLSDQVLRILFRYNLFSIEEDETI